MFLIILINKFDPKKNMNIFFFILIKIYNIFLIYEN